MLRSLRRSTPAALLFGALAIAGFGPQRATVRPDAASSVTSLPCDLSLAQSGGSLVYALSGTSHLVQPLPIDGNVAACSLAVSSPTYAPPYIRLRLEQWDPTALTPDPTTVEFRSRVYDSSSLIYVTRMGWDLSPAPVVTRSIAGVADGRSGPIALELLEGNYYVGDQFGVVYDDAAPTALPAALASESGSPFAPISGPHAALWQDVCGQDADTQALRVLQAVMTTGAVFDTSRVQIAQRFRVPEGVQVRWIEVATTFGGVRGSYDPGLVMLYDAYQQASPAISLGAPFALAGFSSPALLPGEWTPSTPFDQPATLLPGHDYWLIVQTNHDQAMLGRYVSGPQSPAFTDGVGPAFARNDTGVSWEQAFNEALDFRLIGVTANADAVPPAGVAAGGLRLEAAPNPAAGRAMIAWSGARGIVRVEVLDVRGRRLDAIASLAGTQGRWLWSGATASGARLPAGVYFLRATDAAGQSAVTRVVLAR